MPYRDDRTARDARREARARERERGSKRAPFDLRPSRASLAALALGGLAVLALAAALVRPEERALARAEPPAPSRSTQNVVDSSPSVGALGGLAGLGGDSATGLGGLGALAPSELRSGRQAVHAAIDTLFGLPPGSECEVDLQTADGECAALVQCGARVVYESDRARGLECIRGLGGVTTMVDRATSRTDGSPAFTATIDDVQLLDDAPGETGVTRLTFPGRRLSSAAVAPGPLAPSIL
jgi:hypothetical protein